MMYVFRKRNLLVAVGLVTVLLSVIVLSATAQRADSPANDVIVALDAGHGGADGGATGRTTDVRESEINLKITMFLKEYFENSGVKVVLTRNDDNILSGGFSKNKDMEARKKIVEESGCNMLISVHLNTFSDPSVRGAQAFFDPKSPEGREFARLIQNSLNKHIEPFRPRTELRGDYYMLKCTVAASVIVECGFLSSPEDERLLTTPAHQKKLALAIFSGAMQYMTDQVVTEYLP
jgi:N-acetylmuramoyl-L-alanine amidase